VLVAAVENPATPDIVDLLEAHLSLMRAISPPGSVHALDLDGLCMTDVTFWSVRDGGMLVGCGAMKALDDGHGEIKSMHVREAARGRGIAALLVGTILEEARRRGMTRLSLETGSTDHFLPARRLYARFGFAACGPFADYAPDPHSAFMTRAVRSAATARPSP